MRADLCNPWSETFTEVAWCDWGGCRDASTYVVAFAVADPDPRTFERRPLCTRHADEASASHHSNPFVVDPTLTYRYRIVPYDQ